MSRDEWKLALQMGATYIGTVVGAGFASGQEVLQFFTRFGTFAWLGISLATALFVLLGGFIMSLGRRPGAGTFGAVSAALLGRGASRAVSGALLLMLMGVTIAMVAGSGALLQEQMGLPFIAGALLAVIITGATVVAGMRAILLANSVIVPSLLLFITIVFFVAGGQHAGPVAPAAAGLSGSPWLHAAAAAITYAGFNVGLSLTVLVPLGRVASRKRTLWGGAALGSLGLGGMLFLMHMLLTANPSAVAFEVPMARIAHTLPWPLRAGFLIVLWGEIYSTLLANVYGIARELQSLLRIPFRAATTGVLLMALAACQIGFARIVSVGYPLFGYGALIILGLLLSRAGELRAKRL